MADEDRATSLTRDPDALMVGNFKQVPVGPGPVQRLKTAADTILRRREPQATGVVQGDHSLAVRAREWV